MTSADSEPIPDYGSLLRLDGRSFLVLGSGQGIGRQVAHALRSQGGSLVCVDAQPELADEVAAEVDGVGVVADARNGEAVAGAVSQAVEAFGRLDGVVDIIGVARWSPILEMAETDWDWSHDMVLRHAFHLVRSAGQVMVEAGGGTMVFVASISGISSAPFHAGYGAAKAGLLSLVRSAAIELRSANVRVNAIAPGRIATPRAVRSRNVKATELADGSLTAMGRTSDVASAALFLCSELSHYVTGQCLTVDGGLLALSPLGYTSPPTSAGGTLGDSVWSPSLQGRDAHR